MKKIVTLIISLFLLTKIFAATSPVSGLTEISLSGLSVNGGYTFHLYSTDGRLNIGYSEVYIALTDAQGNFVENFTVGNFHPLMDMGTMKHSTPVGSVVKVADRPLYKTWLSFIMYSGQMGGTWSLAFDYTIAGVQSSPSSVKASVQSQTVLNSDVVTTETYTGWFKDRHCTGAVTLPLLRSCGIGCGTGSGGMANCWSSGLGLFIYDPTLSGTITKDSARTDKHFLLFDAESKELVRAFLISLPSEASGKLSVKVTGHRVKNGIPSNKIETTIPELNADSIDHYLNAFHVDTIQGVYINGLTYSYTGFATNNYKLSQADLAPTKLWIENTPTGAYVKFTAPANARKAKSNLTGYKVQVYNTSGLLQEQFTTNSTDTASSSIYVAGLKSSLNYPVAVTALYPSSAVTAISAQSSQQTINSFAITVDNYPTAPDAQVWFKSFLYKGLYHYVSVVSPKNLGVGRQTVKAYVNKKVTGEDPFPTVDGGFKIVATPFMRSMGHSSQGNTALEWNSTENVYSGTLNFSMEGDWRVNLKVYDAVADTLIYGTDLDQNGDGSTLWWDFSLYKLVSAVSTPVSNENVRILSGSDGSVTVQTAQRAEINVFDFTGRLLNSFISEGSKTIILNSTAGVYIVAVTTNGKTSAQKVIVQRK